MSTIHHGGGRTRRNDDEPPLPRRYTPMYRHSSFFDRSMPIGWDVCVLSCMTRTAILLGAVNIEVWEYRGWGAIVVTKRVSLGFVYPDLCLYLQTVVVI